MPTRNGSQAEEKVEAIRVYLDGVSRERDDMFENKVVAGWILQAARVLDDECTLTEAKLTAATGAALAFDCLAKTDKIELDLEGKSVDGRQTRLKFKRLRSLVDGDDEQIAEGEGRRRNVEGDTVYEASDDYGRRRD